MTIQANQGFGVSVFGATSAGGGGSTSPGGSSGQVQYNNGGSFGGMSGTTWTDASQSLAIASTGAGTGVTTSSPVLNLTQTWNAGAVTFTGLKFNATDTASASGSLLLDLQVGGTSQVRVSKAGSLTTSNITVWSNETPGGTTSKALWSGPNSTVVIGRSGIGVAYATGNGFGFSNSTQLIWGTDESGGNGNLILTRAATATLQLGAADAAAPVAQTFKVQGVVAGTTNTAGANFTIQGSQGTGTGAGGSIIFQVAPAGSSGTAQNAYSTALTISSTRVTTISGAGTSEYLNCGTGGVQYNYNFSAGFHATYEFFNSANQFVTKINGALCFLNSTASGTSGDTILIRDGAPNTLALRNGTNAQRFNVYNTYTSSTNYETFKIDWITTANTCLIGTEKGSGGSTARALALQTDGTTRLTISAAGAVTLTGTMTGVDFFSTGANGYSAAAAAYFFWSGRSSLDSPSDGVIRLANSTVTDFGRLQFGGTTSSFPALKRSSASLICRLADDTANAAFESASVKTDAPSGGTSGTWKLGVRVAATTVLDTTQYIEVDVGGTLYKLAVVTS